MKQLLMAVMRFFAAVLRYLSSHAGKAVAFVILADALIAMPDLLGWAAAAFLLYRASIELRAAFRQLDATPVATQEPATAIADVLDAATQLDMAATGERCPAVIIHSEADAPATRPVRQRQARLERRA